MLLIRSVCYLFLIFFRKERKERIFLGKFRKSVVSREATDTKNCRLIIRILCFIFWIESDQHRHPRSTPYYEHSDQIGPVSEV